MFKITNPTIFFAAHKAGRIGFGLTESEAKARLDWQLAEDGIFWQVRHIEPRIDKLIEGGDTDAVEFSYAPPRPPIAAARA